MIQIMEILVFNCGSSSLNYKVFSVKTATQFESIASGKAHRVGVRGSQASFVEYKDPNQTQAIQVDLPDHATAANLILQHLTRENIHFDVIGHRFVHGGSHFMESTWLTEENQPDLLDVLPLASIHNPNSYSVIKVCQKRYPNIKQYLTFDTAFHARLPEEAYRYLLPEKVIKDFGYRKYGFHGLSYQYVSRAAADYLGKPLKQLRMVACHLGTGGSSVAAIKYGVSIDTTMGFTPLAGLVMSTRTGDIDPLLVLELIEEHHLTPGELDNLLNKKSGLLGVSGFSSDIRDIIQQMDQNDKARLAFEMYSLRLRKAIGSFAMILGGLDVLVFTDDIGIQNPDIRSAACSGLAWAGIELDEERNRTVDIHIVNSIAAPHSRTAILAMPTDEEWVIAQEGVKLSREEVPCPKE